MKLTNRIRAAIERRNRYKSPMVYFYWFKVEFIPGRHRAYIKADTQQVAREYLLSVHPTATITEYHAIPEKELYGTGVDWVIVEKPRRLTVDKICDMCILALSIALLLCMAWGVFCMAWGV